CLFEDESDSEASQSDHDVGNDDPDARRYVDILAEKPVDGLEEEDCLELQEKRVDQTSNKHDDEDRHAEEEFEIPSPADVPM
ncbi:hypothetical protein A2U01_0090413, partial [Trifolium medium]|nr:hypothetical protein [Trifolium medium]